MSESKPSAMYGHSTRLVGLRRSLARLIASITNEAVDELKLAKGMTVYAIIKASDVMVGID
jgi:molybdopterin-binding protein